MPTLYWRRYSLTLVALSLLVMGHPLFGQTGGRGGRGGRGGTEPIPLPSGRPVIVFIHGRDQAFEITDRLREDYFGAFRDGVRKFDAGPVADAPGDLVLVNYQDIYEPGFTAKHCVTGSQTPWGPGPGDATWAATWFNSDNWSGEPKRLLFVANPISEGGPSIEARLATFGLVDFALQFLGERIAAANGYSRIASSILNDTKRYLADYVVQCETNRRLTSVIDSLTKAQRPIVLVAHSLGSLISYTALLDRSGMGARWPIARFVTIGSQLGLADFVRVVAGSAGNSQFPIPTGVRTWVNIRGADDFVAPYLIGKEFTVPGPPRFRQFEIATQPGNPHSAIGYLKHPRTAHAILSAWCDAARTQGAPAGCEKFPEGLVLPP